MADWMGIAWRNGCDVLYGSNRSDRNKKSLFQVKLILSNIFFLPELKDSKFFPGGPRAELSFHPL